MRNRIILLITLVMISCSIVFSQENMQSEVVLKHSIGSSLFLLGNIIPKDAVYAFQLDYGYRLTQKDILIVEGIT
jgi:hypothetical protein